MINAKKITSLVLICAMMTSFVACNKVDSEAVIKRAESFAKSVAELDSSKMLKLADGISNKTSDKISQKMSMSSLDSDERTVKKAIAGTIEYTVDEESLETGKSDGGVSVDIKFTMVDYAKVLKDEDLTDADSMVAAIKKSKDKKKYTVSCDLVSVDDKWMVTEDTLKNLADLYSFFDYQIDFGPSSSDIVGMVDYSKWYMSNNGSYSNVSEIELDLYFKNEPGVEYYYTVRKDGSEVYRSTPAMMYSYYAEGVYGPNQQAATDNGYLAGGNYEITFYLASDDTVLTSNTTTVTVARATPTPAPDLPMETDTYQIYDKSFADIESIEWFEYDDDSGKRLKDGVYYGDVATLAFSIKVRSASDPVYYAYYYLGESADIDKIDTKKPDFEDTVSTNEYTNGIFYDIDYTPSKMKPGYYMVAVAPSKDKLDSLYILGLCQVLEQKSTDV